MTWFLTKKEIHFHIKIPFSFGKRILVVGKIRGLPDGELLEENQGSLGN